MKVIQTAAVLLLTVMSLNSATVANTAANWTHGSLSGPGKTGPAKTQKTPAALTPSGELPRVVPETADRHDRSGPTGGVGGYDVARTRSSDTANLGDALFDMMFGRSKESSPKYTRSRRQPPTLKKIY